MGFCDGLRHKQENQKEGSRSFSAPPFWEYMLRESIFKTISPPPPGNNALYRRLLEAPFYSGPFPIISNDEQSVLLSRGAVYYSTNDHWVLCQEGCNDCEICTEEKNPTLKWILRRIKRISSHGSPRYDLQLTVIPQSDGSYHLTNLWPRSYIYVATQGERTAYSIERSGQHNALNNFRNLGDDLTNRKSNDFWKVVGRDSISERRQPEFGVSTTSTEKTSERSTNVSRVTVGLEGEGATEQQNKFRNFKRPRARPKPSDRSVISDALADTNRTQQLMPKLILGTDQRGQKHLVHVVPADNTPRVVIPSVDSPLSNSPILVSPAGFQDPGSNKITQDVNRAAYHRVLRTVFDSLHNHRRSIQRFLDQSASQLNRVDKLRIETPDEQIEESGPQETRYNFTGLREIDRRRSNEMNKKQNFLRRQLSVPFRWNRQKRKTANMTSTIDLLKNENNFKYSSNETFDVWVTTQAPIDNTTLGQSDGKNVIPPHYYIKSHYPDDDKN